MMNQSGLNLLNCVFELCCIAGIMAILFCGIVMSHYTHLNLSPVTQITVQQTFRTIAFMAGETEHCRHSDCQTAGTLHVV